jgi:hypothetical protein
MKKLLSIFLLLSGTCLFGQTLSHPNIGTKSHPTLNIDKIELTANLTILHLSIKNELEAGGWFCADKNIVLKNSTGTEVYSLVKSENIPVCPKSHQFKKKGEILRFTLYFPVIGKNVQYLDLVEQCNDACFSIKGIILDQNKNLEIENAFRLYNSGKTEKSGEIFGKIATDLKKYPYGIYYFNAIKAYSEAQKKILAKFWFDKLSQSDISDKNYYIDLIVKNKLL